MDINALYGTKDLAVEAGDTVFDVLQNRNEPAGLFFHVNHICRADRITVAATRALIEVNINNHLLPTGDRV